MAGDTRDTDRKPEWMVDQVDHRPGRDVPGSSGLPKANPDPVRKPTPPGRMPRQSVSPPPIHCRNIPLRLDYYPPPKAFRSELSRARQA